MPVRLPVAALVLAVGLTLGLVAVAVSSRVTPSAPSRSATPAPPSGAAVSVAAQPRALAVLEEWDRQRAAAWAAGDASALSRLYVAASTARDADLALLRRYTTRGLVVEGLRMQVLRARVLALTAGVIRLEVTDRVAAATAVQVRGGAARRLPVDAATTRELVLRRVGGRWLMARVSVAVGAR